MCILYKLWPSNDYLGFNNNLLFRKTRRPLNEVHGENMSSGVYHTQRLGVDIHFKGMDGKEAVVFH